MSIWNFKKDFNKNPKNKIPQQNTKKVVKYSAENIEKVFNFLLSENFDGDLNFDVILSSLEHTAEKGIKSQGIRSIGNAYESSESATSVDAESKLSKSNWCDIGKESREKEYKDSELKHWVDRVADKYDSED